MYSSNKYCCKLDGERKHCDLSSHRSFLTKVYVTQDHLKLSYISVMGTFGPGKCGSGGYSF